ncbi:hypothetical protein PTTG_01082, partial [Puccinia triticina 1-1 BBBD Race 1]
MTTRNTNTGPLLPISDPEEILRTARQRARLDALAASNNAAIAQTLSSDHPNYDPNFPAPSTKQSMNPTSSSTGYQPEDAEQELSL